jgi:hypothetical protein
MAFGSKKKHGLLVAAGLVFTALSVCCLLIHSANFSMQASNVKLVSIQKPTGPESSCSIYNLSF